MKFAFLLLFMVYILGVSALPAIERANDELSFGNLRKKLDNAATDPTRAAALIEELEHVPGAMLVQLGSQQSAQLHSDRPSTRTWIIGATTGVIIGISVLAFILYFCCFKYDYSRYLSVDLRAGAVKGATMPGSKLDRTPILESPADGLHLESEESANAVASANPTGSATRAKSSASSKKRGKASRTTSNVDGASGAQQGTHTVEDATNRRISAPHQPHRRGSHLHEAPIHHAEKVASRLSPEELAAMEARAAEAKNQIARQISKEIAAKEDSDLEEELLHEEARLRGHSAAGVAHGH